MRPLKACQSIALKSRGSSLYFPGRHTGQENTEAAAGASASVSMLSPHTHTGRMRGPSRPPALSSPSICSGRKSFSPSSAAPGRPPRSRARCRQQTGQPASGLNHRTAAARTGLHQNAGANLVRHGPLLHSGVRFGFARSGVIHYTAAHKARGTGFFTTQTKRQPCALPFLPLSGARIQIDRERRQREAFLPQGRLPWA